LKPALLEQLAPQPFAPVPLAQVEQRERAPA
jgi:hypothetical protein